MRICSRTILLVALCLPFVTTTFAQETLWNELDAKASKLYQQGKYSDAEKVTKEALEVAKRTFGSDHPDVATTLNNLALLYRSQGKYAEAEPLYKRALVIYEKALGKNHPQVAQSLNNLGLLYYFQGRYARVEPFYKRALAIWEDAFGPDHPNVLTVLENMSDLYKNIGKEDEAKRLEERVKIIRSSQ